jgi:hypothetical protein
MPSVKGLKSMKILSRFLGLLLLLGQCSTTTFAQQLISPSELLTAPGQTIASHKDSLSRGIKPSSNQGVEVVGYSIERIDLGQPKQVESFGATRSITTNRAWRVRVYANNLQVRSAPITVWIGNKLVGRGIESEDLSSVTAVTTDSSLIENGQPVGLSYHSEPDVRLVSKAPIELDSAP